MAMTFHVCWTVVAPVMSWSPCRLKVEELEGERSRLEQEKQALEMQMERLTLQVGLGGQRSVPCTDSTPSSSCERNPDFYTSTLTWLRATAGHRATGLCHSGSLQGPLHTLGSGASQHGLLSGAVPCHSRFPVATTFSGVCIGLFLSF